MLTLSKREGEQQTSPIYKALTTHTMTLIPMLKPCNTKQHCMTSLTGQLFTMYTSISKHRLLSLLAAIGYKERCYVAIDTIIHNVLY